MEPGRVVADRFAVEHAVGSGGMGVVFAAKDRHTGRRVALKIVGGEGTVATDRFLREGALLAGLTHPSIVGYVAHGVTDRGERWLAMEWLEGKDLAARIEGSTMSVRESVRLAIRIAEALSHLHAKNIVHRDVKPSNVFLPEGGTAADAKLLDFGLARLARSEKITQTGAMVGTPAYMAPEQACGGEVGPAADVFGLGCLLFEMLIGRPPFAGESTVAILARVLLEQPPSARAFRGDIPEDLDAVITRMLAKQPSARYPDAAAAKAALEAVLADVTSTDRSIVTMPPPGPRGLSAAERRVVTLVLVSSSVKVDRTLTGEESKGLDRELEAIATRGALRLDRLADGSLLFTAEGEGAATDRAMYAARCALELHNAIPGARVAIATGAVVAARGAHPIGEAIETAANAIRSPRTRIAIDEATAALLDTRFEISGTAADRELAGERALDGARLLLGKPTPFVGRERELAALMAAFDQAASESMSLAVLVTGSAGAGKSRLRHELLRRLAQHESAPSVWIARADPMHAGSPLALIIDGLRRAAGIKAGGPLAERREALVRFLSSRFRDRELKVALEFIGELVGAPDDGDAPPSVQLRAARENALLMGDQMRAAWESVVAAECAARPLVLVLEDLHWGDRPTVQWIGSALRNLAGAPLLVIALARPEIHAMFPRIWAERAPTEVALGELSKKAALRLVRETLGPSAGEELMNRIADRCGGNPFFLEELVRAAASGDGDELPGSVLAMVQARLDGLDASLRHVLRAASVFGRTFWKGGVATLVPPRDALLLDDLIERLVERELVTRSPSSRFPGEIELVFRHALLREGAYAMLTAENRATGHRAAGEWLEAAGELDASALAMHFDLGRANAEAIRWYQRAAEHALEGNDFDQVVAHVERAVALGAEGEARGRLRLLEGEARRWRADRDAEKASEEAMGLLPHASTPWFWAAYFTLAAHARFNRVEGAAAVLDEMRRAMPAAEKGARIPYYSGLANVALCLRRKGDGARVAEILAEVSALDTAGLAPLEEARVLFVKIFCLHLFEGDPAPYIKDLERAIELTLVAGDRRLACAHTGNLGWCFLQLGDYVSARSKLEAALADAHRLGLADAAPAIEQNIGLAQVGLGLLDEAKATFERSIARVAERPNVALEAFTHAYLADLALRIGDLDATWLHATRSIELHGRDAAASAVPNAIAARVEAAQGRMNEAVARAERAAGLARLGIEEGEAYVRLAFAEILHASGFQARAKEEIAAANEALASRAATVGDADLRKAFLAIEEHRRTIELASEWT